MRNVEAYTIDYRLQIYTGCAGYFVSDVILKFLILEVQISRKTFIKRRNWTRVPQTWM